MLTSTAKLDQISKLAAGRAHSLAIRQGKVHAWGDNTDGQLGDGTKTKRSRPVPVSLPVAVVDIAGGRDHSLAVPGPTAASGPGDATTTGSSGSGRR